MTRPCFFLHDTNYLDLFWLKKMDFFPKFNLFVQVFGMTMTKYFNTLGHDQGPKALFSMFIYILQGTEGTSNVRWYFSPLPKFLQT